MTAILILIIDNRSSREAVILELKKADGKDISKLKNAAETSLEQIRKNNYDRDLKERNYRKIVNLWHILLWKGMSGN